MRISFDIDDTLILHGPDAPAEPGRFPAVIQRWLAWPLRRGTRSLMRELRRQRWEIWIYTSSGRTSFEIRRWLWMHGIRVDGVVNEERHRCEMERRGMMRPPTKYPPAFGIDLHVDDSEGVRMEGEEHGFRVVVVSPQDPDWARKVLEAAA